MELLLTALAIVVVAGLIVFALLQGRGGPPALPEAEDAELEPGDTITIPPEAREAAEEPDGEGGVAVAERPVAERPPAQRPPEAVEAPPAQRETITPEAPALTVFERFRLRLAKASGALGANLRGLFAAGVDEEAFQELEDALIAADVGVEATMELVEGLRDRVREEGITEPERALALLQDVLRLELGMADRTLARRAEGPTVWLFTGVNGTGKTTTIGKLARRHRDDGEVVVLAAADTFRAAAGEQLEIWAERAGAQIVRKAEGADPASVAFDSWRVASQAGADLLMIDTAGRLQNKRALMDELSKVKRVLEREAGPADEVLLVIDATTGQNGLSQARAFMEAVDVTGVVLTKLDGTAKGGIVIAIQRTLDLPVKLVGLGEGIDDLETFDPDAFVEALFAEVGV